MNTMEIELQEYSESDEEFFVEFKSAKPTSLLSEDSVIRLAKLQFTEAFVCFDN